MLLTIAHSSSPKFRPASERSVYSHSWDTAQWLSKLERSGLCHSPKDTHCDAAQPAGPRSTFVLARQFKSSETLRTDVCFFGKNSTVWQCSSAQHMIYYFILRTDNAMYVCTHGTMSLPSQKRRRLQSGSVAHKQWPGNWELWSRASHTAYARTHAYTNSTTGQTKTLLNLKLQTILRWEVQWSHLHISSAQGVWPSCYSSEGKGESVPVTAMKAYREQRYRTHYVKSG